MEPTEQQQLTLYAKIPNRVANDKRVRSYLHLYHWFLRGVTSEIEEDGRYLGLVWRGQPIPMGTIAGQLGVTRKTVQRGIKRLVQCGYLIVRSVSYNYGDTTWEEIDEVIKTNPYRFLVVDSIKYEYRRQQEAAQ